MTVHVLYRSYGGENMKGRPSYYGKRSSLASLVRSVEEAGPDVDVTFLNNGAIPDDRVALMGGPRSRIVDFDAPTLRQSYRFALRTAIDSDWPDEDVVYLVEDDYLHLPGAIGALVAAVRAMPEVSYFLTYGSSRQHATRSAELHEKAYPPRWRPAISTQVEGQTWCPGLSGTSTFAVRLGALRKDHSIILQSYLPYRHQYRDHATGLVWQGYEPYRWGAIARDALLGGAGDLRAKLVAVADAPFKAAFNLRAHRRHHNRRFLYVATPNLATHMESARLAPGRDWAQVAHDVDAWLAAQQVVAAGPEGRSTA
jgi:hypothetical protein